MANRGLHEFTVQEARNFVAFGSWNYENITGIASDTNYHDSTYIMKGIRYINAMLNHFRKDKLLKVIRDRPVAILLPGPSISKFIQQKHQFDRFDWCWASMNKFWVIEREHP